MATATFDLRTLLQAADEERQRQGLSWSSLSAHVGVSASTIRRFGVADDAEADGVLAIVRWLGVSPETFVCGGAVGGRRLSTEPTGFVRVDMDAVARAAGQEGESRRTRTTIHRLVTAAEQAGMPVASLTRLSAT